MKRIWNLILICSIVIPSGLAAGTLAQAQVSELETAPPVQIHPAPVKQPPQGGEMPGWPVPDKIIPYHEPGRPSRADGYSTTTIRQDEMGADQVVLLTGLDALLIDGVMNDPFQGNYRLVEENQILSGLLNTATNTLTEQTTEVESSTLNLLDDTQRDHTPAVQTDVTSGDLNGDGIDEQITAWFEDASGSLNLSIGEMPPSSEVPGVIPPKVTAQPAAVSYTDGSMDVVVRGYDGALWLRHYDGSSWGDWSNDGGGMLLSGPAIASRAAGQFDVFALGFNDGDPPRAVVYARHYESDAWTGPWTRVDAFDGLPIDHALPLPELPAPAAVARSSGSVDVFWLNEDKTLHWCQFDGSVCASGQDLGGMLASGPSAVSLSSNEMQVFARGVDDSVWYRAYNSGWGSWGLLEMPPDIAASSAPAVVTPTPGQITVFVQGKDTTSEDALDALWHRTYDSGWGSWELIWEYDDSEPFVKLDGGIGAVFLSGVIKIFAHMENGSLGSALFDGTLSTWTIDSLPATTEFVVSLGAAPDLRSPLKVEAGHYWGAGRELYTVAYVTTTREISVSLFDIGGGGDGFTPNLLGNILLNVEYSTADGQDDMDLAAGDLNGDGRDEIIVASIDRYRAGSAGTHWLNVVDVSDCSDTGCTLSNSGGTSGTTSTPWSQFAFGVNEASTIHIGTGDLNGDGDDEVAVGSTGNYMGDYHWSDVLTYVDDGVANSWRNHGRCDYMDGDSSAAYPGPCTSGDLAVGNFIQDPGETVVEEIAFISPWIHSCNFGSIPTRCQRFFVASVYQLESDVLVEMGNYTAGGGEQ